MSRGSKTIGVVEGVDEFELFETVFHQLCARDGFDADEVAAMSQFARILTALEEWVNRLLIALSSLRGLYSPPTRMTGLVAEHERTYGVAPLASAAD